MPIEPLDHDENDGDDVDITVTVVDGAGEEDDKDITIDVDDVDDEAPAFSQTSIAVPIKASRKVDAKTKAGTTSLTVNQEQNDKLVVVVQLSEVWSDVDSDEDDLDFDLGGRSGLPDWVTVYGPDDWEDIWERRSAVDESDAPTVRDGDQVIVIVIDRTSGEDGDNEGVGTALASFTLTATDDEGNSTTETISINVSDTNVPITVDEDDPVVAITGTASGLGHINMAFGADQDPDLDEPGDAVLVLYTWSTIARDDPDTMMMNQSPWRSWSAPRRNRWRWMPPAAWMGRAPRTW